MKEINFDEILKVLKERELNPVTIVTKYEKLGDTVFPVNYHSNGIVTIDYPDRIK